MEAGEIIKPPTLFFLLFLLRSWWARGDAAQAGHEDGFGPFAAEFLVFDDGRLSLGDAHGEVSDYWNWLRILRQGKWEESFARVPESGQG